MRTPRGSDRESLHWWKTDLTDVAAVRELVRATRPQIIFHLASYVAGARDLAKVVPTFHDNLASTVYLLTAVAEMDCPRIVLANSSEEPQDGSIPRSPYAAAKWASGAYGRMFHQLFRTPVVMPRIFMTYGPDQKDLQKLVPFITLALLGGEVPKLSSGRRMADWIYVDDVVEGLVRAATAHGIEGCTLIWVQACYPQSAMWFAPLSKLRAAALSRISGHWPTDPWSRSARPTQPSCAKDWIGTRVLSCARAWRRPWSGIKRITLPSYEQDDSFVDGGCSPGPFRARDGHRQSFDDRT